MVANGVQPVPRILSILLTVPKSAFTFEITAAAASRPQTPRSMESIAMTGLAIRLPDGIEDFSSFWDMLEHGRNLMKE